MKRLIVPLFLAILPSVIHADCDTSCSSNAKAVECSSSNGPCDSCDCHSSCRSLHTDMNTYANFYRRGDDVISPGEIVPFNRVHCARGFELNIDGTITVRCRVPRGLYKIEFFVQSSFDGPQPKSNSIEFAINEHRVAASRHTGRDGSQVYAQALVVLEGGDELAVINPSYSGILTLSEVGDELNTTASIIITPVRTFDRD